MLRLRKNTVCRSHFFDAGGEVAKAYGSLGGFFPIRYAKRHTFIIDPDGRIAQVWRKVDPAAHSNELLEALNALRQNWQGASR